jgi:hypothetical protein
MTINNSNPEHTTILNTEGFKPFTLTIDCMTEGFAIQLWAALAGTGEAAQREQIKRFLSAAALTKFEEHVALGLSEGLYPIWDALDDMLVAQGVIVKPLTLEPETDQPITGRKPSDTEAGIPIFE